MMHKYCDTFALQLLLLLLERLSNCVYAIA
jgi:hypothetical protein